MSRAISVQSPSEATELEDPQPRDRCGGVEGRLELCWPDILTVSRELVLGRRVMFDAAAKTRRLVPSQSDGWANVPYVRTNGSVSRSRITGIVDPTCSEKKSHVELQISKHCQTRRRCRWKCQTTSVALFESTCETDAHDADSQMSKYSVGEADISYRMGKMAEWSKALDSRLTCPPSLNRWRKLCSLVPQRGVF